MQFSVGDKVVHPHHGPGQVIGVESKDLSDGSKRYYVIEIPLSDLTLYVPRNNADEAGVRPAMSRAKLDRALATLQGQPRTLPQDHKERQEQVWEKLRTGRVIQIAEVVRDLTWHREREHLTKKDSEYLDRAQRWLGAEIALVSNTELANAVKMIDDVVALGLAGSRA